MKFSVEIGSITVLCEVHTKFIKDWLRGHTGSKENSTVFKINELEMREE
jgi:hypothetical protein